MIRTRTALVAVLMVSAAFSRPAAAQHGDRSKSLTHAVSATIAPRVKARVSAPTASNALGLSVRATQSYVVSMKAVAPHSAQDSNVRWSSSSKGEFRTLTSADTVLVVGNRSSSADTAVFFREAERARGESTVLLTVSAP